MVELLFTSLLNVEAASLWQCAGSLLELMVSAVATLVLGVVSDASLLFQVGECNRSSCPGSFYLAITAAWANIGYMTHADFVHFVWNTSFGLWAALFYAVGAAGALVAVSINQPPRTYMWFFMGPAIYAFLVGTPTTVQGVAWRIANKSMEMEDVWRDAETGMANTALVKDIGIQVSRKQGPSGTYQVAWTMAFLDGLFSEATNNLVSWIGMQRREGRGGADSNLFSKDTEEGPWQILSNLKWGMVENIVGVNVKDPDVRDTLATFLTSECGDWFKKGVNAGAYSAASQSRGANIPGSVFIDATNPSTSGQDDKPTQGSYDKFVHGLDVESIPTPRSMIRLFNSPDIQGSFRRFMTKFSKDEARDSGRLTEIVCSEYLYMIVQAMRWEAGHAYWQLIRSFPNGFTSEGMALKTLFYGWNLRQEANASLLEDRELIQYTKFLILGHLLRNELIIAPQVTEMVQRFSPSEQMRGFTEAYVRQQGSRAKYGELYQWAVMMPHVQGILAYLVLIGYPFAAMLMVIPGYWKAFFTWISFFAWVKLWDVGFAIVHTLERSVWAMIGNHSAMARVGRRLINTASQSGDIVVQCEGSGGGSGGGGGGLGAAQKLSELCSVPMVKERGHLSEDKAWFLLDQLLAVAGSLDLDLSNGYYIYIMAALYFAVPAVTGQLVLGAKASLGALGTQAIGQSAQEAGGAAKSGTVGENTTRLGTNQASMDQAAKLKSYRQSGFAQQSLDQQNAAMDADIRGAEIGGASRFADAVGNVKNLSAESFGSSQQVVGTMIQGGQGTIKGVMDKVNQGIQSRKGSQIGAQPRQTTALGGSERADSGAVQSFDSAVGSGDVGLALPTSMGAGGTGAGSGGTNSAPNFGLAGGTGLGTGQGKGGAAGALGMGVVDGIVDGAAAVLNTRMAAQGNRIRQAAIGARAQTAGMGLDLGWDKSAQELYKGGHQAFGQRLAAYADFEAASAAFDAKNTGFAVNGGMHAVLGAPPGSSAPGQKPADLMGAAMSGQMGTNARNAARYSGSNYFWAAGNRMAQGKATQGSNNLLSHNNWQSYEAGWIGVSSSQAVDNDIQQITSEVETVRQQLQGGMQTEQAPPQTTAQNSASDVRR
jgi:hypothetical protein